MKNVNIVTILCLLTVSMFAQIQNGNFEVDGNSNLNSWIDFCGGGTGVADAPPTLNSGDWCLQLTAGNTQSCMYGYLVQPLNAAQNGQVWRLRAWARLDSVYTPWTPAALSMAYEFTGGMFNIQKATTDTTSNKYWTALELIDTIQIPSNHVPIVLLDAGLTGGPALGISYFDMVSAERIDSAVHVTNVITPESFQVYPNPVKQQFTITLPSVLTAHTTGTIQLINTHGQVVLNRKFDTMTGTTQIIDTSCLTKGVYYMRINTNNAFWTKTISVQ